MIQVAAYCRVSTDKTDQANSFENQREYMDFFVGQNPDWELYNIYADKGASGTSTEKRESFNKMINDAFDGKFKLIITKAIDRFSRNVEDLLRITRELKAINVGVFFLTTRINTLDPDAESKLILLASVAQEESRYNSERIRWGQKRQMEKGVVFGHSMLGYDVRDGKLIVDEESAEIVRLIFQKYGFEKKGTSVISRELREAGFSTRDGYSEWDEGYILKVLKNEKYVGDLVQQKTITPDYLTHKKKYNHDESTLIKIEDHHEPIIDRELWDLVQEEIEKRNVHGEQGAGHSNRYPFSGKIKCGECGTSFVSRKKYLKDGSFYRRWACGKATNERKKHTDAQGNERGCDVGKTIREDIAVEMLKTAVQSIPMDTEKIIQNVTEMAVKAICDSEERNPDRDWKLEQEIKETVKKKKKVMDTYFSGIIHEADMRMMCDQYDDEIAALQMRLDAVRARANSADSIKNRQKEIMELLTSIASCEVQSDIFMKNILEKMVVHHDGHVELTLNNLPQQWNFEIK